MNVLVLSICDGGCCRCKKKRSQHDTLRGFPSLHYSTSDDYYCSSPSPCSFGSGVNVPNSPFFSLSGPAVKYKVVAGALLLSFPNTSAHSPSIFTGCLLFCCNSSPMNLPVNGLKASIQPLRKFPTRRVWLNSPKFPGARVIPHGASKKEPCSNRPSSLPSGLKMLTRPSPAPPIGSCLGASCFAYVT